MKLIVLVKVGKVVKKNEFQEDTDKEGKQGVQLRLGHWSIGIMLIAVACDNYPSWMFIVFFNKHLRSAKKKKKKKIGLPE